MILPTVLDEPISHLHQASPAHHPAIYQRYESKLGEGFEWVG